ncbi:hypothetical protein LGM79_04590 [Burkholderia multivorans]|nr:hypothetical protein [Burkholderia multivorans]
MDFTFTSGKPPRMRHGDILQHACHHGTYHRGNADAPLQLPAFVPGRDSVTDFLEKGCNPRGGVVLSAAHRELDAGLHT